MVARIGREFCLRTRTRAALISHSIPITQIFCSPHYGRHGACPGVSLAAARAAGSIVQMMVEPAGSNYKNMGCRRVRTGASVWRLAANPDPVFLLFKAKRVGVVPRATGGGICNPS